MQRRKLGGSGLETAPIVFGGNVFGWTADQATSFALLDAFVDAGFNVIDTADVYSRWAPGHSGGESETVIGNWIKKRGHHNDVVIATKVGSDMGDGKTGLAAAYIKQAVEASLRRLGIGQIDLYQEHFDDGKAPVAETMEAFAGLVKAGKVRAIGASNISPERLRESQAVSAQHGWPRYETLQPHYNLVERAGYEKDFAPLAAEMGLGVIPYWSLASGFLTGKYRSEADLSKSPRGGSVKKYLDARGHKVLAALDEVAGGLGATPAQVALAWLLTRPSIAAPIASATSVAQWQEIARAAELTLSGAAISLLDAASA
jgi:aryl-alcohol dehydrogenase-like predicted oxidoreductase